MGLNRGEWSEFLAVLDVLENPNIKIVNSNMSIINEDVFTLKNIRLYTENNTYLLSRNKDSIEIICNNEKKETIHISEITENKIKLLNKIKNISTNEGSFDVPEVHDLIKKLNGNNVIKSKSTSKSDIDTDMQDKIQAKLVNLKYSIKSQIGSPATILNASHKTNIRYKVSGVNDSIIEQINQINTRNKLVDRLSALNKSGATISFDKIMDTTFENNLQMIDSLMPNIIADICLRAYTSENKNLIELFNNSSLISNKTIARKKLADLLKGFSFDIKPGTPWTGNHDVNGGIMIVTKNGNLYVLDLVYHIEEVENYLINNTKLDSPSSTRYNMLHLYKENNNIYFTLNLQIRYR